MVLMNRPLDLDAEIESIKRLEGLWCGGLLGPVH